MSKKNKDSKSVKSNNHSNNKHDNKSCTECHKDECTCTKSNSYNSFEEKGE